MPWSWNLFGRAGEWEARAYTLPYLDHVLGQYADLPVGAPDARTDAFRKQLDEIKAKRDRQPDSIEVNDIFLAEGAVLNLLPFDELKRRAPFLRNTYRTDMGAAAFAMYQASGPPDPATATSIEPLRADLSRLLDELHWMYIITPVRERIRSQISRRISGSLLVIAGVGTVYGVIAQSYCPVAFSWIAPLSAFMGAAGAFVSLQQRIQSIPSSGDPIFNIFALKEGMASIYLSPVSGALFAILMYLLFVGGYFKGELFPAFREEAARPPAAAAAGGEEPKADHTLDRKKPQSPSASTPPQDKNAVETPKGQNAPADKEKANAKHSKTMSRFLAQMEPVSATDFAKLLIWCFIAGFAERLIPDTLNRLIVHKLEGVVPGAGQGDSIRNVLKEMVEQVTTEAADAKRDAARAIEDIDKANAAERAKVHKVAAGKEKDAELQAVQDLQSGTANPVDVAKRIVAEKADAQIEAIHQTEDAERRSAEARSNVMVDEASRIKQAGAKVGAEEVKPQPVAPAPESPPNLDRPTAPGAAPRQPARRPESDRGPRAGRDRFTLLCQVKAPIQSRLAGTRQTAPPELKLGRFAHARGKFDPGESPLEVRNQAITPFHAISGE